jgi:hypothetical protein
MVPDTVAFADGDVMLVVGGVVSAVAVVLVLEFCCVEVSVFVVALALVDCALTFPAASYAATV